jgi:drug/metabolite transporter (DMT)-like permease
MKKGYFLVFLTAIISGFSIFINKFGVAVINSNIFTFLKNLVVAILLSGILFFLKDWKKLKELTKKQWFLLVIIGLVGGSIPFLLFFKGLSLISAAQGAFWHKTMFLYVAVLATIFFKEKIDKKFLFGGLLLILGNLVLLKKLPIVINKGDVLVILATIFWASENVISKYALKNLESRIVVWGRMFFGAFFIFIFLLGTNQLSFLAIITLNQINWVIITSLLLFGYVMTWYSGLKYIPVSQATVILVLGSPITTLLSLISGGRVSYQEILSSILVILGIIAIIGFRKSVESFKDMKKLVVFNSIYKNR